MSDALLRRAKYLLDLEIEWVERTAQYHESPWVADARALSIDIGRALKRPEAEPASKRGTEDIWPGCGCDNKCFYCYRLKRIENREEP